MQTIVLELDNIPTEDTTEEFISFFVEMSRRYPEFKARMTQVKQKSDTEQTVLELVRKHELEKK